MVSYTPVTDIVRASDKLKVLTGALENVEDGVVLLDRDLNAVFLNRRMREFWEVSEEEVARHPAYVTLIARNRRAVPTGATAEQIKPFRRSGSRRSRRATTSATCRRRTAAISGSIARRWQMAAGC